MEYMAVKGERSQRLILKNSTYPLIANAEVVVDVFNNVSQRIRQKYNHEQPHYLDGWIFLNDLQRTQVYAQGRGLTAIILLLISPLDAPFYLCLLRCTSAIRITAAANMQ